MKIKDIKSRKVLNSAAKYTIETTVILEDGSTGVASIPGGLSKGATEVATVEPDKAVKNVLKLEHELTSRVFNDVHELDKFLIEKDGTDNKSNLGGNTILSISIAFTKAKAKSEGKETYEYIAELAGNTHKFRWPKMMMLMLEGGLHGSSDATIQEFMAIVDSIDRGVEIYNKIKDELKKLGKSTNVGAEGAFSPDGYDNDQTLSLLSGFLHGEQIAIDVAASSFENKNVMPDYETLLKNYPIASIEDPYDEKDWTNWELFGEKYTEKIIVVTDDITTTNPKLLQMAIEKDIGNAILVKPNQIGSVSETLEVIRMAHNAGWQVVVSHRGTDTNDDFIADLAVGSGAEFTKFGSPARGERIAKYNRLLGILE